MAVVRDATRVVVGGTFIISPCRAETDGRMIGVVAVAVERASRIIGEGLIFTGGGGGIFTAGGGEAETAPSVIGVDGLNVDCRRSLKCVRRCVPSNINVRPRMSL